MPRRMTPTATTERLRYGRNGGAEPTRTPRDTDEFLRLNTLPHRIARKFPMGRTVLGCTQYRTTITTSTSAKAQGNIGIHGLETVALVRGQQDDRWMAHGSAKIGSTKTAPAAVSTSFARIPTSYLAEKVSGCFASRLQVQECDSECWDKGRRTPPSWLIGSEGKGPLGASNTRTARRWKRIWRSEVIGLESGLPNSHTRREVLDYEQSTFTTTGTTQSSSQITLYFSALAPGQDTSKAMGHIHTGIVCGDTVETGTRSKPAASHLQVSSSFQHRLRSFPAFGFRNFSATYRKWIESGLDRA
ncbi:hypothetical protein BJ508DRAFT_310073 [Ascobolus immersus RN42]|uniref:Uncharacterized protein n=1 Tax=Ascobolus immersus RN42 TaxID=1160509 RepID=A0A3N4HUY2_ASCIM|nr:hypothetical protein BJ508DRAFT_310073 [Ascobolus immersus RN42]